MTTTPTPDYTETITEALRYLDDSGAEVPAELRLRARRLTQKAAGSLAAINARYRDAITDALVSYFEGGIVTGPRNHFRAAVTDAFYDAFYLGWADGGGGGVPSAEGLQWLTARVNQEYGFIDMLFQQVKDLRKDEEFDFFAFVTARADGYVSSVLGVYNAGVMFGKSGRMLTWQLGNTEKHCDTCLSLRGGRHRASWYISRNYIPRQPGAAMDCHGYNCDCRLVDDNGKEVTL